MSSSSAADEAAAEEVAPKTTSAEAVANSVEAAVRAARDAALRAFAGGEKGDGDDEKAAPAAVATQLLDAAVVAAAAAAAELSDARGRLAEAARREAERRRSYDRLDSAFRAQVALAQQSRDEVAGVARRAGEAAERRAADAEARVKRRDQKIALLEQTRAALQTSLREARERADAAEQRAKDAQAETARIRESSSGFVVSIGGAIADQARRYTECTAVLHVCAATLLLLATSSSDEQQQQQPPSPKPKEEEEGKPQQQQPMSPKQGKQQQQQQQNNSAMVVASVVDAERKLMELMEATTVVYARAKQAHANARQRADEAVALRQQLGLQQGLLEEVRDLRSRYFFSVVLNIKQSFLVSALSPAMGKKALQQAQRPWRDVHELYDEATTAQIPVAEWPRWISVHIDQQEQQQH